MSELSAGDQREDVGGVVMSGNEIVSGLALGLEWYNFKTVS